ncbi:hypothetical protein IKU74_08785 [bacterium]|nr:hypothetical protein [bacterium]
MLKQSANLFYFQGPPTVGLNLVGVDDAWYELWSCLYPGYEYYQNNEKEFENIDGNLDFTDINLFPDLDSYDY